MNQPVHGQGRPKQPTEKEKYFMQQQAKLKQFGRGSMTGSSLDPTKLVDSVFGTDSSKPKSRQQGEHGNNYKQFMFNSVSGFMWSKLMNEYFLSWSCVTMFANLTQCTIVMIRFF